MVPPFSHFHLSFIVCVAYPCLARSLSLTSLGHMHRRGHALRFRSARNLVKHRFERAPSPSSSLPAHPPGDGAEGGATKQRPLESLRAMRVTELKAELDSLNVSTRHALEKEELVRRLFEARERTSCAGTVDGGRETKKQKRRRYDASSDASRDTTGRAGDEESNWSTRPSSADPLSNSTWTIVAPFVYYELKPSTSVAAQNAEGIFIRPTRGKYAAIKVQLKKKQQSVEWTLLVDTACSGLVLSPDAVDRANRRCPGMIEMLSNSGATMTMAGSSQGASVAKWDSLTTMMVGGVEAGHANVAACQDIGALPAGLDGILGLSLLGQFSCVDFDFVNNQLRLGASESCPSIPASDDVVAQGPMSLTKLGVYTVDVTLDGRGPVTLLVDTGAAGSFLNWRGVSDMRLSSSSPRIEQARDQMGAMGADNVALRLTHRFPLGRRWNLIAENNSVGDFCPGVKLRDGERIDMDIGDLPVLETLRGDGVGGILGSDLLMMCGVVRLRGLGGRSPSMILMKH